MTPTTFLKKVRKFIERGWCQGYFALNKEGREVDARSRSACKWCLIGAICKTTPDIRFLHIKNIVENELDKDICSRARSQHQNSIEGWNDKPGRTQKQVLNLIDRVLKKLEKI
jgi:hypothetical protein